MTNRKGFTLIEVIVILAVLSILAAVAIPMALRIFERTAEDTTREEMDNLKKALLGDLRKLQTSFRNDFGFLGDIGCLPTTALGGLDRLSTAGTYPTPFTFDSTKQAGAGWKGPYISGTPGEDFKKDQLGNDYTYTPQALATCPLTATLISNGPNGLFESGLNDDIVVNIVANDTTATIRGTVKNTSGTALAGVPVELYYPSNGTLTTSTPATTDANGNYSFSSVPFGARAVKANPTLVLVPGSVTLSGGGDQDEINFQVKNYSGSSITVGFITVNCTAVTNTAVQYDDIRVNSGGADLTPGNNNQCKPTPAQINISPDQVIGANPTPPSSMRIVIDSADTQLPDLTLSGGTTITFNIQTFENSGGTDQNMTGQTISVSFYTPALALISTVTVTAP